MGNNPDYSRIDLTVLAKNRQRSFIRQMRLRFLATVLLLCMVYISSYTITRENIKGRKMDAFFVNLSGRQRMLSQRIAMFSLRLVASQDEFERRKLRDDLANAIKSMEAGHNALIHGKGGIYEPFILSEALKAIYFSGPVYLDKQLHIYFEEARAFLSAPDAELTRNNPRLQYILSAAYADLIDSLDKAVGQYELESRTGILRFENTEFYLTVINILILLLIALFIFRPMTVLIQRNIEALTIANEFNDNLLKTIPFGMDIVDKDGTIVYLNEKFKALFSKSVIGKKCYEVYKDDRQPCDNCPLKKGVRIGKTDVAEVDGILGGRAFRISHTGMVYQGKKSVLEIFEDITEIKKVQDALQVSEEKYRRIFENAPVSIVLTDGKGRITDVNPWHLISIGGGKTTRKDYIGKSVLTLPQAVNAGLVETYKKLYEEGYFFDLKEVYFPLTSAGVSAYLNVKGVSLYKDNKIVGALIIHEDITEEKKAEERLKEALSIKSDFVSMVSHELRTPLTAIKEGIAIVMDGSAGNINVEQKEFLDIAEKNVERLSRLINNVLDYQRLESGRLIFDMHEADINYTVRETEQIMANSAKNKGLEFIVELAEGLPKIIFDSDKIIQVLINLVSNAIKFTEKGWIKVRTSKTEDAVCVSVQDTGIGIKGEDAGKLFQSFSQLAKGAERQAGSTGLGLAISEKIIQQHKGKIWFESEHGKGSTFYFTLPIEKT